MIYVSYKLQSDLVESIKRNHLILLQTNSIEFKSEDMEEESQIISNRSLKYTSKPYELENYQISGRFYLEEYIAYILAILELKYFVFREM